MRILFRLLFFFFECSTFSCLTLCFLWPLYCFGMFLLMFGMFIVCFIQMLTIISHHQVQFLFMFISILTMMLIIFNVTIALLQRIYGYFFQLCFILLNVCFNNSSNIKLRLFVILIISVLFFLLKHIKVWPEFRITFFILGC